ncbi:signal recognition particle-docking protein FtsY [Microbaculum marinum]|uniref:Signal recognition particle receptor FtsY n=1 Tax=Microbaculum marinum TaxID=1764581 RepID=A0AAW9S5D8_9HYPH
MSGDKSRPSFMDRMLGRSAPAPAPAPAEPAAEQPKTDETDAGRPESAAVAGKPKNWLQRLTSGLARSSSALGQNLTALIRKRRLDDETLQDLEDILVQADLGVETAVRITERLARDRYDKEIDDAELREVLASEITGVLEPVARPLEIDGARRPHVVLVVGVNGSGKTTTIGKLAAKFRADGKSVVLGAGDTFRAAAIEQLKIWGERTGSTVVARPQGSDASGLAFDALKLAREQNADLLMLDTAGRLQNKANLMAELEKIVRVLRKQDETAPHTVLLVLDATTGQNAMNQVEIFTQVAGVTGLVMTKLDGTARGGILVAIAARHGLPVHAIGVGEGIDDLQPFEAKEFARAIVGETITEAGDDAA